MQIKNAIAISCDQCGSVYRDNFIYYSFDFKEVDFKFNTQSDKIFSLDVCSKCVENMLVSILNNNKNSSGKLICEITGKPIVSNYFSVSIAKVNVSSEGLKVVCKRCDKQYNNKLCECGSNSFVNIPNVLSDTNYLSINICDLEFDRLKTKYIEFKALLSNSTVV